MKFVLLLNELNETIVRPQKTLSLETILVIVRWEDPNTQLYSFAKPCLVMRKQNVFHKIINIRVRHTSMKGEKLSEWH